jgi:hypothetical protein
MRTVVKGVAKVNPGTVLLMLATFFNPFGFDALFALIMKWTGSYWITDVIFYCLSGLFFGLYFLWHKRAKTKI